MSIGARNTDQWREHRALLEAISRERAETAPESTVEETPEPARRPWRDILFGLALLLVAALWVAAIVTSVQAQAEPLLEAATLISMSSGPLALLGIAWLLVQRTSRREARRFGATAAAMRAEAVQLERTLARLALQIEDNRKALATQADELLSLGEDSALRLTEIGANMRGETGLLSQQAEILEKAAATARADMAQLHADLPRIEAQVAEISALMADAGQGAEQRTTTLVARLADVVAHSRDADAAAGGATERLVQHIAQVESAGAGAGERIDALAKRMDESVDAALARTAEAVDAARHAIETTGAGLLAVVEQGTSAIETAGHDSAIALSARIEAIGGRLDALTGQLRAQEGTASSLLSGLDGGLSSLEQRFRALGENGASEADRLSGSITALRAVADEIGTMLVGTDGALGELIDRSATLKTGLDDAQATLAERLPRALDAIDTQAGTSHAALAAMMPEATRIENAMAKVVAHLSEGDAAITRQRGGLESMAAAAQARIGEVEEQARAFAVLLADTGENARLLADGAGPKLIDALLRVRDAASQAADRARETLSSVIPGVAAAMGDATRHALEQAVGEEVEARVASVSSAAEQAVHAAQQAAERLMRQMLTIADTTQAVEARIAEVKADAEKADEDNFARRVALLIESLNSTSIDVAKILSNENTDSAWAAYLKGDRGIFTRRAVKLLDTAEAREIARHYEAEPEFRDQVNRYIHDFEAMLRRVLATRDGAPLGVTLLSSDMGKLYVALAQAIERLRK